MLVCTASQNLNLSCIRSTTSTRTVTCGTLPVVSVADSDAVQLRPSVLRQDRSQTRKISLGLGLGLGLGGLVFCCETRSCHARHHNDLEGHKQLLKYYLQFILCLEHHYCGDQQWRLLTLKLNPPSALVYFRWSWSCYFCLGLGIWSCLYQGVAESLYSCCDNVCMTLRTSMAAVRHWSADTSDRCSHQGAR